MMNIVLLLLVVAFLGAGCGQNNTTASQVPGKDQAPMGAKGEKYIQEGVDYLNKAELADAIKSFNKAVALNPRDPKPYFILAEVYMRLNNYENAIANLNNVIALESDNGPAFYFLGICKGLSGNRKEAIVDIEHSVAIFQQKKDEVNFKKALTTLQQMMQAENVASPEQKENM